jgi:glycerate-2-kinase
MVDGDTAAEAAAAGFDLHDVLKRHDTTPALWQIGSGVLATHNISIGDLGVILILEK